MAHSSPFLTTPKGLPQARVVPSNQAKINIGSGLSGSPGWFNIDNSPTVLLSHIPVVRRMSRIPATTSTPITRLNISLGTNLWM